MGIAGFIREREYGCHKASRYRYYKQDLNNWLDRLAAAPALNQPCEFSGEPKATFLVDFSPDGKKIASSHGDHTVRVTEIATGKCTHILTGHPRTPWCLAFHPSHNDILASGCLGGQVRIWDLRGGGSEVFTSDANSLIASLTFHPVDNMLVFSTKNKVYFWDWTLSKPFISCSTKRDFETVRWVKFDSYGHYLYTGICNGTDMSCNFGYSHRLRRDQTRLGVRQSEGFLYSPFRNDRSDSSSSNNNNNSRMNLDPTFRRRMANRQRYLRLLGISGDAFDAELEPDNLDIEEEELPTSPVHEDRLRQAYDYASYVTSHSRDSESWMQLSARRSGQGNSSGSEQSSSSSSSSFSRYSAQGPDPSFLNLYLRARMLANSPPPQPHRDSDSDEDAGDQHTRNILEATREMQQRFDGVSDAPSSWNPPPPSFRPGAPAARTSRDGESSRDPASWVWGSASEQAGQGGQSTAEATSSPHIPPAVPQGRRQPPVDAGPGPQPSAPEELLRGGQHWLQQAPVSVQSSVGASSAAAPAPGPLCGRSRAGGDSEVGSRSAERSAPSTTAELQAARTVPRQTMCPHPAVSGQVPPLVSSASAEGNSSSSAGSGRGVPSVPSLHSSCASVSSSCSSAFQVVARTASHSDSRVSGGGEAGRSSSLTCVTSSTSLNESGDSVPSSRSWPLTGGEDGAASDCPGPGGTTDSASTTQSSVQNPGRTVSSVSAFLNCGSTASSTHAGLVRTGSKRSFSSAFGSDSQPGTSQSAPQESASSRDTAAGLSSVTGRAGSESDRRTRAVTEEANRLGSLSSVTSRSRSFLSRSWSNPWQSSGASSSVNRGNNTEDRDGLGDYQPGNLSCSYLYRFYRTRRNRNRRVRMALDTDINNVRQRAQDSNYMCDLYAPPPGFRQCPICRTLTDDRHIQQPGYFRVERRQRSMLRSRLMPRMPYDLDSVLGDPNPLGSWDDPSERTSDGTSQTMGDLNEPERADQGTDVIDLDRELARAQGAINEARLWSTQSRHHDERGLEHELLDNNDLARLYTEGRGSWTDGPDHERLRRVSSLRVGSEEVVASRAAGPSRSAACPVTQGATPAASASGCATSSTAAAPSGLHTSSNTPEAGPRSEAEYPQSSASVSSQSEETSIRFRTLPSPSGSNGQTIEVMTGAGERETITYSELARRMANRDDVLVVGNHWRVSAEPQPASSSVDEQQRSNILRLCLVRPVNDRYQPRPTPPPSSSSSSQPGTSSSTALPTSQLSSRFPPPPRILVQRPSSEDQPQGTSQESANPPPGGPTLPEQRNLHPHYARSVMEGPLFGYAYPYQSSINSAIAGVFMSSGEQAVASNIVSSTYRIQRWDMRRNEVPDLTQQSVNIVVQNCKIHNDASVDLSRDSSLLATFVHIHGGFPDENVLGVFSLRKESFGQCLYTKSFGPNAISVSVSPSNRYLMVGLASKRMLFFQVTDQQLVGQIFQMVKVGAGEDSMKHVTDVYHPVQRSAPLVRGMSPVSVNSACWLPEIGAGIVYGTNHGDLHFFRAGRTKAGVEEEEARPRKLTISTQTGTGTIRRSAFTQTAQEDSADSAV